MWSCVFRSSQTDQFQKYINRYGSGLVIYWNGFIEDLQEGANAAGCILVDAFPTGSALRVLPKLSLHL